MAKVNQLAQGFLDLLDAKTGGMNPSEFLNDIRPVIDMVQFYGLGSMDSASIDSATITSPGDSVRLDVPANQFWMVYAASAQIIIATLGSVSAFSLRTITPSTDTGNIGVTVADSPPLTTTVASQRIRTGIAFGQPLLMRPGQAFQVVANLHDDAVAGTAQVAAQITRFGPASRALSV